MKPAHRLSHHFAFSILGAFAAAIASFGDLPRPCNAAEDLVALLDDSFADMKSEMLSSVVGAETEYHYLPETAPRNGWAVSNFRSLESQRGWRVQHWRGKKVIAQTWQNRDAWWHALLTKGDPLWDDYTAELAFAPMETSGRCGLAFRSHNDRNYYYVAVEKNRAVLGWISEGIAYRKLREEILAEAPFAYHGGDTLQLTVAASGKRLRASISGERGASCTLEADDDRFAAGKIALLADAPAYFERIRVSMPAEAHRRFLAKKQSQDAELARLQAANPKPVLWKKIKTYGFGVGRNLRFGDLNGDGKIDVLTSQMRHLGYGLRDVGCMTAMTFDGKRLWQNGKPDNLRLPVTNDVGVQIHDLDGDGKNEVVYCRDFEIVVADGATGKTKYKTPTPATDAPGNPYPRILGDCLFFCDLRGTGRAADVIVKDRYRQFWALNDRLETMWTAKCITGHYPFACDIDGDGRDELAIGYSLFKGDGKLLWSLDNKINDHCDGVAVARFAENRPLRMFWAASDEGALLLDTQGNILKHYQYGHVQNPAIANFRDDMPGLELVSINFWCNQGILNFFDSEGNRYLSCEPAQYGSMCLPVNWTGRTEEYFVLSANVEEGGMYDGRGRRVVAFPDDGHPDMCNAVLDITGDRRDEIVVWDPYEIWVYTQDDNPKSGKLYRPRRNPLYNYSNYQATVSLPE
jgi:rhamnogalacturonan endolyase